MGLRRMLAASVVLGSACLAWADTLWVGSAGSGAVELRDVRVLRIEAGRVFFRTGGNESSREVGQVQRMALDDEPALTSAESAFSAQDWQKATDDYLRAQRSTTKPWLKPWITVRLMTSATRAGRFDAAVTAYVELVASDPALAQQNRPVIDPASPPKPGVLDAASADIERALARPTAQGEQRTALLQLLLDVQRARGDTAKAARTLEQLAGGTAGTAPAAAGAALADLRLSQAQVALDAKDFAKAVQTLEQNPAAFTEPRQQAEALWVLASAREGLARTTPGSGGGGADKDKLRDAALTYMRLVAHFKDTPGASGRVPPAMLRTATILEDLGEKSEARRLYRELAEGNDPAVKDAARQGLERTR